MASKETRPAGCARHSSSFGRIERFDTLITRSVRRASRYINGTPNMSEDLAQDVRAHLVRRLTTADLENAESIRRCITNAIRDRIRYEQLRIQLSSSRIRELSDPKLVFGIVDDATRPEILSVSCWVASLPDRLRFVFNLLYRFGLTQREAASALEMSQATLNRLHQELLIRGRVELAALA